MVTYQRANANTVEDNTGTYFQVLINSGSRSFTDQSSTYFPEQPSTASTHPEYGPYINAPWRLVFTDATDDGRVDLIAAKATAYFDEASPFAFIQQADGSFAPLNPRALTRDDYVGFYAYPLHIDDDDKIDVVSLGSTAGPDGEWGTTDDITVIETYMTR